MTAVGDGGLCVLMFGFVFCTSTLGLPGPLGVAMRALPSLVSTGIGILCCLITSGLSKNIQYHAGEI